MALSRRGRPLAGRPKRMRISISITQESALWLRALAARETMHNQSAWIERAVRVAFGKVFPVEYQEALDDMIAAGRIAPTVTPE